MIGPLYAVLLLPVLPVGSRADQQLAHCGLAVMRARRGLRGAAWPLLLTQRPLRVQTDADQPQSFTQTFHLCFNAGDGGYYIFNDIFRLILHNA